jgi:hypothetical protein
VKIQMRPIAEQFEVQVPGFPYGLQEIHCNRLRAIDLSGDAKLHGTILQDSWGQK